MLGRVAHAPPASRVGLCAPCWPACPGRSGTGAGGQGRLPGVGEPAPCWARRPLGGGSAGDNSKRGSQPQPSDEDVGAASTGDSPPCRSPRASPASPAAGSKAEGGPDRSPAPLAASDPAALRRVFSLWPLSSLFSSLWGQTGGPPAAWPDTRSQGRGVGRTGSLGDCAMPQFTHQRTSLKTLTSRGARWVRRTWAGSGGGGAGPAPHGSGGPGRSSPGARPERILRRAV